VFAHLIYIPRGYPSKITKEKASQIMDKYAPQKSFDLDTYEGFMSHEETLMMENEAALIEHELVDPEVAEAFDD